MTDQPDETPIDPAREQAVENVVSYLQARQGGATLMGRSFDVSRVEGKREFAEWFIDLLWEMDTWLDAEEERIREATREVRDRLVLADDDEESE